MQPDQIAILALLGILLGLFASDRLKIEVVAIGGLAAGLALGLVDPARAFDGFASPAVITVVEILLIVGVVARARLFDRLAERLASGARHVVAPIAGLLVSAALLSMVMNNIGAMVLMLPVALSLAARLELAPGRLVMPLAFATLLGGLATSIGTPANLVISQARLDTAGAPFALLDFAWVGLPVAAVGLVWLVLAAPGLLDRPGRLGAATGRTAGRRYVTEIRVGAGSPLAGLARAEAARRWGMRIHNVWREDRFVFGREEQTVLEAGDVLVVEANEAAWTRFLEGGHLERTPAPPGSGRLEAVVMPDSVLVGSPAGLIHGFAASGIAVLAVAPRRRRIEGRLADLPLAVGDVLVLEGGHEALADAVAESEALALSTPPQPEPVHGETLPLIVFGAALVLAAADLLRPEIALGLGVLGLTMLGRMSLRSALSEINWPIVVMLAAMIPLGSAVETTGAAAVLGDWIVSAAGPAPPLVLVGAILLLAVALTPFVNNVATAVVLAPIAIETAHAAGLPADPFLIAVALGASLDFLTPFGHHNNTLAMGVGGYRFADFPRVGGPLVLITMAAGLVAIDLAWLP